MMFEHSFNSHQLSLFFIFVLFFIASIIFHIKDKNKLAVLLLFCGVIFLYLFAALLDPFLWLWDERFHALVAKNLMKHPLLPTLYDDILVGMKYDRWDRYHFWVHKQPLFLWQIALSFKLFGVNEFTLRIPSAILSSLLVIIAYRTAKLLTNSNIAYYTAFLFATSFCTIEFISGKQQLDHNDLSFMFYISASIWAWVEYIYSKNKYWLILIGVFSGFAFLCKWVLGLLVYLPWLIYNLQLKINKPLSSSVSQLLNYSKYKDFLYPFSSL